MLRNKLNLRGERSHGETYKTLMKEIEEDKKKIAKIFMFMDWKNQIVKMPIVP